MSFCSTPFRIFFLTNSDLNGLCRKNEVVNNAFQLETVFGSISCQLGEFIFFYIYIVWVVVSFIFIVRNLCLLHSRSDHSHYKVSLVGHYTFVVEFLIVEFNVEQVIPAICGVSTHPFVNTFQHTEMVAAAAMVFIPVVQHILNEIQLQHSFFPIFTVKYCENKEWEKVAIL